MTAQPQGIVDRTTLWFQIKIDGNHAARFSSFVEAQMPDFTKFEGDPEGHRTRWCLDFWKLQLQTVGVDVNPTLEMHYNGLVAHHGIESFLDFIKPIIEEHDLPKVG
jgi:hypothetical protein